jgi:hypothetical protein
MITTPIENVLVAEDYKVFANDFLILGISRPRNLISFLKDKLGRQDYCMNGEFRFWVWEKDSYTIYASNKKGLCFEVNESMSSCEAMIAWKSFLNEVS